MRVTVPGSGGGQRGPQIRAASLGASRVAWASAPRSPSLSYSPPRLEGSSGRNLPRPRWNRAALPCPARGQFSERSGFRLQGLEGSNSFETLCVELAWSSHIPKGGGDSPGVHCYSGDTASTPDQADLAHCALCDGGMDSFQVMFWITFLK